MVSDLENGTNVVRESRIAKSQYFMNERHAFMGEMAHHIKAMIRKADRENKKLAVRPNGSSDIAFEYIKGYNGQTLPEQFPDIQFVDYTKNLRRMLNPNRPSNYHLTFSLSETNMHEAIHVLANRKNVAVVFGDGLPDTFMGHRVIDGTEHDLRHLDPQPVIVGLDPKAKKQKPTLAVLLCGGIKMGELCFDIDLRLSDDENVRLEVTENYEGDKYHVVVFIDGDHWNTVGLNSGNELLKYMSTFNTAPVVDT